MPIPKEYEIDSMAQEAETITANRFGDLARTPKGRTTLRAILEATCELATSEGLLASLQPRRGRKALKSILLEGTERSID